MALKARNMKEKQKKIRVVAALLKNGDKILLAKRATGNLIGHWEFPGGKIEDNESLESAVIREIKEELGLIIIPVREVSVFTHEYDFGFVELTLIECELNDGDIKLDGSHSKVSWEDLNNVGKKLAPLDMKILDFINPM